MTDALKKHSLPNSFCGYCGGHRDFAGALVHALDCPEDIGETHTPCDRCGTVTDVELMHEMTTGPDAGLHCENCYPRPRRV